LTKENRKEKERTKRNIHLDFSRRAYEAKALPHKSKQSSLLFFIFFRERERETK